METITVSTSQGYYELPWLIVSVTRVFSLSITVTPVTIHIQEAIDGKMRCYFKSPGEEKKTCQLNYDTRAL